MELSREQIVYTVFYTVISLAAIAGNSIVIYLILNFRQMRSVTNFFILNLAIGDLLMVILCIPFTFTASFLLYSWPFGSLMCRLVSYAQAVSVFISAYTLVAISIDRYIAIIYPLRPRMTKKHSYQVIVLIWFVSLLTPAPVAMLSKTIFISDDQTIISTTELSAQTNSSSALLTLNLTTSLNYSSLNNTLTNISAIGTDNNSTLAPPDPVTDTHVSFDADNKTNYICRCTEDWATWPGDEYKPIYSLLLMLLQYVLPFTILVFTYTRIALIVWGKQTPGESCNQREAKMAASKRKVVQMMIVSGTTFTLCWLPFNVLTILLDRFSEFFQYQYIEYVWFTCHWLAMSHACYNPIIYIWMNSRYRYGFIHVGRMCFETLCCCRPACCVKDQHDREHSYPFSQSVLHVYQANSNNNARKTLEKISL